MKELNITEGTWYINQYHGVGQWSCEKPSEIHIEGSDGIAIASVDPWGTGGDRSMGEANAQAIVTAVNNTYHKGIVPESVEDMKEALEDVVKELKIAKKSAEAIDAELVESDKKLLEKVEEALQKADLNNEKAE